MKGHHPRGLSAEEALAEAALIRKREKAKAGRNVQESEETARARKARSSLRSPKKSGRVVDGRRRQRSRSVSCDDQVEVITVPPAGGQQVVGRW